VLHLANAGRLAVLNGLLLLYITSSVQFDLSVSSHQRLRDPKYPMKSSIDTSATHLDGVNAES
jgi:hypothetical protein